jgi:hypothetical protein
VLIEGDQGAEGLGRQALEHQGGRGPVAGEGLLRGQNLDGGRRHALGLQLDLDRRPALADQQGLGLGDGVGQQLVVHAGRALVGAGDGDELQGHDVGPLVHGLEIGVLDVGALVAEHRRGRGAGDRLAVLADALAVRLHLQLLQEGCEAAQAVGVGHHRAGRATQAVAVVDLGQGQQHRRVALKRRGREVPVHGRAAGQEALEHLPAAGDGQARQADRRPQGVAAADPVPEAEHPVVGDAERGGLVERGRDGGQVGADMGLAHPAGQPVAGGLGVGHGLKRGEGLGDDDDQGLGRVEVGGDQGELGAVDIGDEAQVDDRLQRRKASHSRRGPRSEPPMPMCRMERNGRPPLALICAAAHLVGEGGHAAAHGLDLGHHRGRPAP